MKNQSNIIRTQILISDLQQGMAVEFRGEILTVSRKDIRFDNLFGRYSFRGDMSITEVTRIQFAVPTAFGISIR